MFDCSLGIAGLRDGRFLAACGQNRLRLAVPDEKSSLALAPEE
jgi:hypothetical protein